MNKTAYHMLFESITVGPVTVKNRVVLAPMTRTSASDKGIVTDRMVKYYSRFARGGFGLLITEGIYPDQSYSQGYLGQPGIASAEQVAAWQRVTRAVHEQDARIVAQLMHAGALSQGNIYGQETLGPSAVQPKGGKLELYGGQGPYAVPKAATADDIKDVIQSFTQAARRAKTAGFDGVEIHGANGYILDQFLTNYMNLREDAYGGSARNRVRLLVEVIESVRKAVGDDFLVGIRISQGKVNDYTHKWDSGDAEEIFSQLGLSGVDYIHTTEFDATASALDNGPSLAALAKTHGRVVVIANGSLEQPAAAEQILERGEADLIALGKGALANPDWPHRVAEGRDIDNFDGSVLQGDAKVKDVEI